MSSTAERETVTVQVNGEPVAVDGQTTGAELKAFVQADADATVTYTSRGEVRRIPDDGIVLNHVAAGAELATWKQHRFGPLLVGPDF